MVNFVRTISTAVFWNRQSCHVVRLQRFRDAFKVLACWNGEVSKEQSLAELIALGVKSVEASDQEFIVAGGDTTGWGSAELQLPALSGAELKSALQFELRKQTPIPLKNCAGVTGCWKVQARAAESGFFTSKKRSGGAGAVL